MKSVKIVVSLTVKDDAKISDIISDMDYSFDHKDIVDTEIEYVLDD